MVISKEQDLLVSKVSLARTIDSGGNFRVVLTWTVFVVQLKEAHFISCPARPNIRTFENLIAAPTDVVSMVEFWAAMRKV